MNELPPLHAVMAEFDSSDALLEAVEAARREGYRRMNAYSPYHVEGLAQALGMHHTRLPLLVLCGGVVGALTGVALQYYGNVVNYPYSVGGRPLVSWPMYVPVTFELTILFAALAAVFGMLARNGLPRPYHSVFNAPSFAQASQDRFFVCIEADDPQFDVDRVRSFLGTLGANDVVEVPL